MPENLDAQRSAGKVVDDADDLRGAYFKQLLSKPLTGALIAGAAIVGGIVGAAIGGGGVGAIVFFFALLAAFGATFAIADSKAADAFFAIYAEQRGLTLVDGRGRLPAATPLLRKGDRRYTERSLLGQIADGAEGTLALYTYEDDSTDSDGDRDTDYYRYTVGLVEVPECARFVPELHCRRKFGLRALEKLEDVFRRSKERVKLESDALDDKFEIFAGTNQDANWLRRLFTPTFIVWLTESTPDKFAFELVDGTLVCYVSGHGEEAEELDAIAVATGAVARRLREEALE